MAYYLANAANVTRIWRTQRRGCRRRWDYNALEADVRRTFAGGLQFRGNYTYSKNLDDGSAWNTSVSGNTPAFVEFPLNPKLDWGPAATDVRQAASINASYELPFGPQRHVSQSSSQALKHHCRGWTASAIVALQTGFMFAATGVQPPGNGDTRNPVRPDRNPASTATLSAHGQPILQPCSVSPTRRPTANLRQRRRP